MSDPAGEVVRFPFVFATPFRVCQLPLTITPGRCSVAVDDRELLASFGPWSIITPLDNIDCVELAGPYSWWKVLGGPRLSFVDDGVTFATSAQRGVCMTFQDPVRNVFRVGKPHPGLTVTVEDPVALHDLLVERRRLS